MFYLNCYKGNVVAAFIFPPRYYIASIEIYGLNIYEVKMYLLLYKGKRHAKYHYLAVYLF